jgi:hypothetical protein
LGGAPLAPLQWGDIVECRISYPAGVSGSSGRNQLPSNILAALRKRSAFPITFEIHGRRRKILVRGDRPFFAPTTTEVPLEKLQSVVELLWQPGVQVTQPPLRQQESDLFFDSTD